MGEAFQALILPTIEDVVRLNRRHIESTGGKFSEPYNLQYEIGLRWVLDFLQHPLVYGANPYPTVGHKGGLLAWTVIGDLVFYDGNKRTGMSLMRIFLLINGMDVGFSTEEMVKLALDVYDYRKTGLDREAFCELIQSASFASDRLQQLLEETRSAS